MRRDVQFAFPRPDRLTLGWMVALLAIWLVTAVLVRVTSSGVEIVNALVLSPQALMQGRLWTVLTYGFLHPVESPFPLLWNLLMLYFFAPPLVERWGRGRFLLFAGLTLVGGAVSIVVASLLGFPAPGMGAGALCMGLFLAWGLTFPDRTVLAAFVIPVRGIHMVYLSIFIVALEAVSTASSTSAQIGGMVTAAALVLGLWRGNAARLAWDNLLTALRIRKKPKLTLVPPMGGKDKKGPDSWVH